VDPDPDVVGSEILAGSGSEINDKLIKFTISQQNVQFKKRIFQNNNFPEKLNLKKLRSTVHSTKAEISLSVSCINFVFT
jgi:hypothetical protein